MKHLVFLPVILTAVLASRTCGNRRNASDFDSFNQGPQPPAANSGEWLRRLTEEKSLPYAFAELPPLTEWEVILKRLRQQGKDSRSIKLRLFGEVLAEDNEATSQTIRTLLLTKPENLKGYSRKESLKYLYTFSKDTAETGQWIEKSLPKAAPESDSHSGSDDEIGKLLAENKIDEAVTKLRGMIDSEKGSSEKLQDLGHLAKIARLTEKHPLYEKTITEMKDFAWNIPFDDIYGSYAFSDIFKELAFLKDWQSIRKIATRYRRGHQASDFHPACLVATYQLDGPAAYLAELRRSSEYGVVDTQTYLEMLMERSFGETIDFGELTIRAYIAAGERENARVTLTHLLALDMGNDTFYRLAIEHFPDHVGAMFEAVRPYNIYQERPLIWLADLALQKNDLARAQELIDQAIALDPSDGEQRKYTRMQAYDVLSRILRAKGDAAKADFFAEVVRAIRHGEEADDFLQAGLIQEAIRRYEEALGHFKDAYCLQSRLAKTLLKAGKEEEAMEHFEKAFELMPVSFGPVESHCFGCERIFEDQRVQKIALKTFNRLIESTPKNPRTFYLLGILLEEMKKPEEAVIAMRKALELDPKYYNCAKRLVDLLSENPATLKDSQATLKLVAAMAPYEDLQEIFKKRTDLRQAWLDAQTPLPSPLKLEPLPLPILPRKAKDSSSWQYFSYKINALDGWSTQELLKDNSFVEWIDDF
jgi:tetratricopeptide (TPR) repeat protein